MANKQTLKKRAQEKLPKLFGRYGGVCQYCHEKVIVVSLIPPQDRIHETPKYLIYRKNGEILKKKIASVDHIVPLGQGGKSGITNLILSCTKCNRNRARQLKQS